jgi:hypothetical protein
MLSICPSVIAVPAPPSYAVHEAMCDELVVRRTERQLRVLFSPSVAAGVCSYIVTAKGLQGVSL